MTIPLHTTTVSVLNADSDELAAGTDRDPWGSDYDTPTDTTDQFTATATGVRAVIRANSGALGRTPGSELVEYRLVCDPVEINYLDRVLDETTQTTYEVVWSNFNPGIAGLGHTEAGLRTVRGFAAQT